MKKLSTLLLTGALLIISMLTTSTPAIAKLKKAEGGFRAKAYADADGHSIGFGHFIRANEAHLLTQTVTLDWANKQMRADIAPLELQINQAVPKGFNQNQFDALIDFGYNCGSGALSKVLVTWNSTHSTDAVTKHINQYVKSKDQTGQLKVNPVLVARRDAEALLFSSTYIPKVIPFLAIAAVGLAYIAFS